MKTIQKIISLITEAKRIKRKAEIYDTKKWWDSYKNLVEEAKELFYELTYTTQNLNELYNAISSIDWECPLLKIIEEYELEMEDLKEKEAQEAEAEKDSIEEDFANIKIVVDVDNLINDCKELMLKEKIGDLYVTNTYNGFKKIYISKGLYNYDNDQQLGSIILINKTDTEVREFLLQTLKNLFNNFKNMEKTAVEKMLERSEKSEFERMNELYKESNNSKTPVVGSTFIEYDYFNNEVMYNQLVCVKVNKRFVELEYLINRTLKVKVSLNKGNNNKTYTTAGYGLSDYKVI